LDDNRLTSWRWVFAAADVFWITPVLAAGLFLAAILVRAPFPGRRPAGALFLCSFAVAAVSWGEPEVIVDASRYFTQAKHLELYGLEYFLREWGGQIAAWTDLPLIPLLYGLVFRFAGEDRIYIQIFTTLLFSASVVLTYLIGRTLWDETTGFYAGALLLGMPYLLAQVPLMLVDVPAMFFLLLAVFTTLTALERGGPGHLALASVAVALAFWTKYSAWLFLSVLPVVVAVRFKDRSHPALVRAGVLIMISMVLIGATLLPVLEVVGAQLRLLQSYQLPGLAR
ncbi:MAG: glycosyltransferase family 39 protein, partial [Elusimicrobiota bacterium]